MVIKFIYTLNKSISNFMNSFSLVLLHRHGDDLFFVHDVTF